MKPSRPALFAALVAASACPPNASAASSLSDPFGELEEIPALQETGRPCARELPARPLDLSDVIDIALCGNLRTASAWAAARSRAATVGGARSAYLPSLSAAGSMRRTIGGDSGSTSSTGSGSDEDRGSGSSSGSDTRYTTSASLSYLLFDFGGRGAALDAARALLDAARLTRNAVLQDVYRETVSGYHAWVAADGSLQAAYESERAAQSSLDAASARERSGTATRADRLQAQTALAQTQLARVQAQGRRRSSLGALANLMGLPANTALRLAPPPVVEPTEDFVAQLDPLVIASIEARPDLAASKANLEAARGEVRVAQSAGLPTLSTNVAQNYSDNGRRESDSTTVGLSVSLPLFSGFENTYRVRAAEAQVEARRAEFERLRNQISLEVYQAHSELATQTQSVFTAQSLIRSAEESESVARERYKAGVGTIIDLINAQDSTAGARRQLIQARSDWASARTRLAQAVGTLDPASDPDTRAPSR